MARRQHRPSPPSSYRDSWYCLECGTTETPVKRSGPHGSATLCNACGLRLAKRLKNQARATSRPVPAPNFARFDHQEVPPPSKPPPAHYIAANTEVSTARLQGHGYSTGPMYEPRNMEHQPIYESPGGSYFPTANAQSEEHTPYIKEEAPVMAGKTQDESAVSTHLLLQQAHAAAVAAHEAHTAKEEKERLEAQREIREQEARDRKERARAARAARAAQDAKKRAAIAVRTAAAHEKATGVSHVPAVDQNIAQTATSMGILSGWGEGVHTAAPPGKYRSLVPPFDEFSRDDSAVEGHCVPRRGDFESMEVFEERAGCTPNTTEAVAAAKAVVADGSLFAATDTASTELTECTMGGTDVDFADNMFVTGEMGVREECVQPSTMPATMDVGFTPGSILDGVTATKGFVSRGFGARPFVPMQTGVLENITTASAHVSAHEFYEKVKTSLEEQMSALHQLKNTADAYERRTRQLLDQMLECRQEIANLENDAVYVKRMLDRT